MTPVHDSMAATPRQFLRNLHYRKHVNRLTVVEFTCLSIHACAGWVSYDPHGPFNDLVNTVPWCNKKDKFKSKPEWFSDLDVNIQGHV